MDTEAEAKAKAKAAASAKTAAAAKIEAKAKVGMYQEGLELWPKIKFVPAALNFGSSKMTQHVLCLYRKPRTLQLPAAVVVVQMLASRLGLSQSTRGPLRLVRG